VPEIEPVRPALPKSKDEVLLMGTEEETEMALGDQERFDRHLHKPCEPALGDAMRILACFLGDAADKIGEVAAALVGMPLAKRGKHRGGLLPAAPERVFPERDHRLLHDSTVRRTQSQPDRLAEHVKIGASRL